MATYNYKPGLGNVASYQASGIPWVSGNINCKPRNSQVKLTFPLVTRSITIINADSNEDGVRVAFASGGVGNNASFSVFGTPVTLDVKVTEVYLTGSDEVAVVASLTGIEAIHINNDSVSPSGSHMNWSGSHNANVGQCPVSDPKNKWTQPDAPPPPMFFGQNERDLVKQVNDELAERVLGQTIAYYSISLEESNFNQTYGEAVDKVTLPPVRVFAYVVVDNEQTNEKYGYDYQSKLTINFNRRRLVEDQNLFVRAGDFVQYGDVFYEIVKTYNDTRYYFGQVEHKFQVSAECVRARRGLFRVKEAITRPSQE